MKNLIECDERISSGAPRIKGRRLTVFNVVSGIYFGKEMKDYLEDMDVSIEEGLQAILYCKELKCKEDKTLKKFCSGCILRTINENRIDESKIFELEISDQDVISVDGDNIFFGDKQQYKDARFGRPGWVMAEKVYEKWFNSAP